jgi:hypothetical protein
VYDWGGTEATLWEGVMMSGDPVYTEDQRHGHDPDDLMNWYKREPWNDPEPEPKHSHREMVGNTYHVYGRDLLKVLLIVAALLAVLFIIGLSFREKEDKVEVDFGGANCAELEFMASNPGSDYMADQIAKEMERLGC